MIFKGLGDHYKHIYSGSLPLIGLIYTSNSHRVTEIFIFTGWVMIRSPVPPSAIAATIQGTTALSKMLAAAGTCFVGMTHIGDNTSWIQNTFYIYIYIYIPSSSMLFQCQLPWSKGWVGVPLLAALRSKPMANHGIKKGWKCVLHDFAVLNPLASSNIIYHLTKLFMENWCVSKSIVEKTWKNHPVWTTHGCH